MTTGRLEGPPEVAVSVGTYLLWPNSNQPSDGTSGSAAVLVGSYPKSG
jgi:hypothetical protein